MKISHDRNQPREARELSVREVFFDFEGTLVNFQWQLKPAVEESLAALAAIGLKGQLYGENPSYAHIYNHTRTLSMEGQGSAGLEKAMALIDGIYDKYDTDALTRWERYADTLDCLGALRRKGFQLAVISNVGRVALDAALIRLGLAEHIGVVVSRDDVAFLKPSPEGLLHAASLLDVAPEQCLFVGDSRNDTGAARKAGMLSAYLSGGEDAPGVMSLQPADIEIDCLSNLATLIKRIE